MIVYSNNLNTINTNTLQIHFSSKFYDLNLESVYIGYVCNPENVLSIGQPVWPRQPNNVHTDFIVDIVSYIRRPRVFKVWPNHVKKRITIITENWITHALINLSILKPRDSNFIVVSNQINSIQSNTKINVYFELNLYAQSAWICSCHIRDFLVDLRNTVRFTGIRVSTLSFTNHNAVHFAF